MVVERDSSEEIDWGPFFEATVFRSVLVADRVSWKAPVLVLPTLSTVAFATEDEFSSDENDWLVTDD